jgi:gamma-glutamyltranspeptidase/glutathione hydrolase
MDAIEVHFDNRTMQVFRIGPASCAVPGMVAGLAEAHRLYARLPWPELIAPAVELARTGVELNRPQAYLHAILDPVLRRDADGRRIYGMHGPARRGERVMMRDLAGTLELIAREGEVGFYQGELARRISRAVRERGGRLTADDLAGYRVVRRRAVRTRFRAAEFVSNAPPSAGGLLIAFSLAVLDRLERCDAASAAAIAQLAEVMQETTRIRGDSFITELYRGGAARRLLSESSIRQAAERARRTGRRTVAEPPGLPSTTHISVIDARGNAASLSSSTGCGSGVFVPGTGIQLNNMLGELDLNPVGRATRPGRRLTSMMAPSIVLQDGRPRAPRVYLDGGTLHLEGGVAADVVTRLERAGYEILSWKRRNLFFGGAAAVAVRAGHLEAAGDPRRGGAGVVVR